MNLAAGYGFCYNPGEPVEGFSSFFFVVVMAALFRLFNIVAASPDAVVAMSVIGRVASLVATLCAFAYLYRLLARVFPARRCLRGLSLVSLSLCIDFIFSMTNGLETGFFVFFLVAYFYHFYEAVVSGFAHKSHNLLVIVFGSLVVLTRVDGFLYSAVLTILFLSLYVYRCKPRLESVMHGGLVSSVPIAVALAYVVFRVIYFHDLFPNTYYVKVPPSGESAILSLVAWSPPPRLIGNLERIPIGFMNYVLPSIWFSVACFVVIWLSLLIARRAGKWDAVMREYAGYYDLTIAGSEIRRKDIIAISFIFMLSMSAYVAYVGGDWMPGHRYVVHYLFLVFGILVFLSVRLVWFILERYKREVTMSFVLLTVFAALFLAYVRQTDSVFLADSKYLHQDGIDRSMKEDHDFLVLKEKMEPGTIFFSYARFLTELSSRLRPGDSVAFYEAGAPAIFLGSEHRVIDICGLNDRFIAKSRSGEGLYSLATAFIYFNCGKVRGPIDRYLVDSNPAYIVFDSFALVASYMFCGNDPDDERIDGGAKAGQDESDGETDVYNNYLDLPDRILDDRYEMERNFPYNRMQFFTIYKRIAK